MNKTPLICDTSLLLYLGRIGQIQLLPALFEPIYVPEEVILELDMGRLLHPDTINPRELSWITPVVVSQSAIDSLPPHRLGRGEQAVIAYAHAHQAFVAGLDDQQARQLAENLNLKVTGVLGVILRAKRLGLILSARPFFDEIQRKGFHLSPDLYAEALRLAGEDTAN